MTVGKADVIPRLIHLGLLRDCIDELFQRLGIILMGLIQRFSALLGIGRLGGVGFVLLRLLDGAHTGVVSSFRRVLGRTRPRTGRGVGGAASAHGPAAV